MANGIYNSNTPPIPGNGADRFGDKLVGNQFTDGTAQFTLGNFSMYSNVSPKDSRNFSLGNFSAPITLDTLQIEDIPQAKGYISNTLDVFINYDRSKVTNYTLYGSLRERLKIGVQNVIKKFPAAMISNKIRSWADNQTGNTAVNITYEPTDNQTFFDLNLYTLYNPFNIEFTKVYKTYISPDTIGLRNLVLSYKKYSLYYNGVEYPLQYIKPTSGNTTTGTLTLAINGKLFDGTSTTDSFYIKPNTLETEKAFDSLGDLEKFLVERTTTPKYTAKFQQPKETDGGKVIKATTSITWPTTDFWNIRINGTLFNAYLNELYDIGDTFDSYKTNLISRFLTTAAFKEFDTIDEKVDKVLKIYGRSFDVVKKYIDGLAYMTNVTYDGLDNVPNQLLRNFAQTLGWATPSSIEQKGFLESIFDRNPATLYAGQVTNQTPAELNAELYRRLLVNTAYLFKSKGTRKSIEFMLRFIGAPDALIEFNEHIYVAGQPINMQQFNNRMLTLSGGTYTEEVPVKKAYFSALTGTFPTLTITGYTYGYETVTKTTTVGRAAYPVTPEGYPTKPRYGPDAYFQAGEGWFEETIEHRGKRVVDITTSVFTGNTPSVKTKLNKFTYGEPYLELYRKFPDTNLGFPIVRTTDNKKSWVKKDSSHLRNYRLQDRETNYYSTTDKLILNVKNVELFLNTAQGLEWGVWDFSRRYNCPLGPTPLGPPYPNYGGPDWTQIVVDASKLSFLEFAQSFWRILINVKNRLTIDDGHGGGYPTLLNIYLNYLDSANTCGVPTTNYTYEKMIEYVTNLGDYWIRLVEQFIPATTIWTTGIKYENSNFHRDKFVYKHEPLCDDLECFGSFITCCEPIFNDVLIDAATECGGLMFSGATWQNKITLGGQEYVGNVYYSSTTLTDIPSTEDYLNDMVSILSGITANVMDPNHLLEYYLINDITDPNIPGFTNPNCIVIQGPCGTGEEVCDCPPDYEYDHVSELCTTYTGSTAATGETITKAPGDEGYGSFGARFCVPNSYTTCGTGAPASNFKRIGGTFWSANTTTTQGRLNQVGVHHAPMTASTDWYGFARCIDAPDEGQYLIGLAGDNQIRATLNDAQLVFNPWDGGINNLNFNYWWVWPITLAAGPNNLLLEGANAAGMSPASFGCEIVGPFPSGTFTVNTDFDIFATPAGISTYTANTIFSSLDQVGGLFNTETNTCPSGYTYDDCTDSCFRTTDTTCITYPNGNDAWNINNGVDPHTFKAEICLNVQALQVIPVPSDTDIYAFYDTTSTPQSAGIAAQGVLESWINGPSGLKTTYGFLGNLYHIPVHDEKWVKWGVYPLSGGTFDTPSCVSWQQNFAILPPGSTRSWGGISTLDVASTGGIGSLTLTGGSRDVLTLAFIDEAGGNVVVGGQPDQGEYYGPRTDGLCVPTNGNNGSPPQGLLSDWNQVLGTGMGPTFVQPTTQYQLDFTAFTQAYNAYDSFKGFVYPIIYRDNNDRMMFPLHVYGALYSGTVSTTDFVENPTVFAAGGSLSAITFSNPYTALTATNASTGYVGPGLNNFGWGSVFDLGVSCSVRCGDSGYPGCTPVGGNVGACLSNCPDKYAARPCYFTTNNVPATCSNCATCGSYANACMDPKHFFDDGSFVTSLTDFLINNGATTALVNCEVCLPACEWSAPAFELGAPYNYNDIVSWGGLTFQWKGDDGVYPYYPNRKSLTSRLWVLHGTNDGSIPFLGGNNFVFADDCTDYEEVPLPENPPTTGYSYTVDPVSFKDGIFNIGAQDCFESNYEPCEELVDPCACINIADEEEAIQYQPGDIVCCPEGTVRAGVAFVMGPLGSCEHLNFPLSLCAGEGYQTKCWVPCITDSAVGRKYIVVTNDDIDACDPAAPAAPVECECEESSVVGEGGTSSLNVVLDFYEVPISEVPASVLNFKMDEEELESNVQAPTWTEPANNYTVFSQSQFHYWAKAIINPCCLGDTFKIFFHHYPQHAGAYLNPPDINQAIYDMNINDGSLIEFYWWSWQDIGRFWMHIPNMDDITITTLPGPHSASLDASHLVYFDNTTSLTIQIGAVAPYSPVSFHLQKLPDSNYLTDNGDSVAGNAGLPDRYWTSSLTGGISSLSGALTYAELSKIVQTPNNTPPPYTIQGDAGWNMEIQSQCKGIECTYLKFEPNLIPSNESSDIPVTNPCATSIVASRVVQTDNAPTREVNFAQVQSSGNVILLDMGDVLEEANSNLDPNNYEVVESEVYIVANTLGNQITSQTPYNAPTVDNTTTGPTSETFETDDGRNPTYLGKWANELSLNQKKPQEVTFTNPTNRMSFGRSLMTKRIAGGAERLTNREATFSNFNDWATRTVGQPYQFNDKTIIYDEFNNFNGFILQPLLSTEVSNSQYSKGNAPIKDFKTDYITTNYGSFKTYLKEETGTTLSSLSTSYSAYTNLSAYTNTLGYQLSSDMVFDIDVNGDNINLSTTLPMSDRMRTAQGNFINNNQTNWISVIPTESLNINCGPFTPSRTPAEYSSYVVPQDMCLRIRLVTGIAIQYEDEGFFDYVSTYRTLTNNLFPTNDYEQNLLINSALINGDCTRFTSKEQLEGNVVNRFTNNRYLFPAFGLNPKTGIMDFQLELSIKRTLSGTSSTTTLASYLLGANPTSQPNADDYLTLPVNKTYTNTSTYPYSATSATSLTTIIFNENYTAGLDTGIVTLGEGDKITANLNLISTTTSKSLNSGTTATTMSVRVGTDYTNPDNIRSPWLLFTKEECETIEPTQLNLLWQPDNNNSIYTPIFDAGRPVNISPTYNEGSLSITDPTLELETQYTLPVINLSTYEELPYLDVGELQNGRLTFNSLESVKGPSNKWVKLINEEKVSNFTINAPNMIVVGEDKRTLEINLPIATPTSSYGDKSGDEPQSDEQLFTGKYSYLIYTTMQVKGTENSTFPLIQVLQPTPTEVVNKPTLGSYAENIVRTLPKTGTQPIIIEDVNVQNIGSRIIIGGEMIEIKPGAREIGEPTVTDKSKQFCKCGDNQYIEVVKKTSHTCKTWCCARGVTDYYPCSENDMTRSVWTRMLGDESLKVGATVVNKKDVRGTVQGPSQDVAGHLIIEQS